MNEQDQPESSDAFAGVSNTGIFKKIPSSRHPAFSDVDLTLPSANAIPVGDAGFPETASAMPDVVDFGEPTEIPDSALKIGSEEAIPLPAEEDIIEAVAVTTIDSGSPTIELDAPSGFDEVEMVFPVGEVDENANSDILRSINWGGNSVDASISGEFGDSYENAEEEVFDDGVRVDSGTSIDDVLNANSADEINADTSTDESLPSVDLQTILSTHKGLENYRRTGVNSFLSSFKLPSDIKDALKEYVLSLLVIVEQYQKRSDTSSNLKALTVRKLRGVSSDANRLMDYLRSVENFNNPHLGIDSVPVPEFDEPLFRDLAGKLQKYFVEFAKNKQDVDDLAITLSELSNQFVRFASRDSNTGWLLRRRTLDVLRKAGKRPSTEVYEGDDYFEPFVAGRESPDWQAVLDYTHEEVMRDAIVSDSEFKFIYSERNSLERRLNDAHDELSDADSEIVRLTGENSELRLQLEGAKMNESGNESSGDLNVIPAGLPPVPEDLISALEGVTGPQRVAEEDPVDPFAEQSAIPYSYGTPDHSRTNSAAARIPALVTPASETADIAGAVFDSPGLDTDAGKVTKTDLDEFSRENYEATIQGLRAELEGRDSQLKDASEKRDELDGRVKRLAENLGKQDVEISSLKTDLKTAEQATVNLRSQVTQMTFDSSNERVEYEKRLGEINHEKEKKEAEIRSKDEQMKLLRGNIAGLNQKYEKLSDEKKKVDGELADMKKKEVVHLQDIAGLNAENSSLEVKTIKSTSDARRLAATVILGVPVITALSIWQPFSTPSHAQAPVYNGESAPINVPITVSDLQETARFERGKIIVEFGDRKYETSFKRLNEIYERIRSDEKDLGKRLTFDERLNYFKTERRFKD